EDEPERAHAESGGEQRAAAQAEERDLAGPFGPEVRQIEIELAGAGGGRDEQERERQGCGDEIAREFGGHLRGSPPSANGGKWGSSGRSLVTWVARSVKARPSRGRYSPLLR